MAMIKRVVLFMMVNVLVVVTISVVLQLIGYGPARLAAGGLDYQSLMVFCLVWGMGGAFISLGLSRVMAKWTMGVQLVDRAHPLAQLVHRLAGEAGLRTMPEVGIYRSPELNAFATGPTRNRALVAVSSGLLESMTPSELEGVLGHELTHVTNGDMVTMTLLQGVMNAFVMFLARVIAYAVTRGGEDREERRGGWGMEYLLVQVLQILFGVLAMFVVAGFSRWREYRADRGGARLAGREKMIAALSALQRRYEPDPAQASSQFAAFKIAGGSRFLALLSTHPPLEKRIAALRAS